MNRQELEINLSILEKVYNFPRKKVRTCEYADGFVSAEYIPSGKPWRTHSIDANPVPNFIGEPNACYQLKLKMTEKYHWEIKSPFYPGQPWFAGLTPHNTSGWNGRPDYQEQGITEMESVCRVVLSLYENQEGKE